jgi:trans-aconitate 2-methyltransferase
MTWNPDQYHKFRAQRFAPFEDLLPLIHRRPGLRVIDLGCGTGELTRRLADALPESRVLGIDSSAKMLEKAAAQARPGLSFEQGSIEQADGQWDLVFSHAALHWVENHEQLIPRLMAMLAPGGQLALQMPANHRHPSHLCVVDTAREEPFLGALAGWTRQSPMLDIDRYAQLLFDAGAQEQCVLEKVYPHVLEHADAVAEWTAGTTLVPYRERLPAALHEPFLARYREKLRQLWPTGPVFYGFRRILLWAVK